MSHPFGPKAVEGIEQPKVHPPDRHGVAAGGEKIMVKTMGKRRRNNPRNQWDPHVDPC
jgi:hypothetical protein